LMGSPGKEVRTVEKAPGSEGKNGMMSRSILNLEVRRNIKHRGKRNDELSYLPFGSSSGAVFVGVFNGP
jgi:hypothetical protein